MPAWSDGAGWSKPDQFHTITSGDLDGDGLGELIGRNASTVEIFTWAKPSSAGAEKAWNPSPGQWQQLLPKAESPTFATADGWWDPSQYSTFRLADLDGVKGDELIARSADGLLIYRYDAANQRLSQPIKTTVMRDALGWGQSHPEAYRTTPPGTSTETRGTRSSAVAPAGSSRGGSTGVDSLVSIRTR